MDMARARKLKIGKKYKIRVSQKHINDGICHNRRRCMDALAINEHFDLQGKGYICVEDLPAFTKDGIRYTFKVPRQERENMAQFDSDPTLAAPHHLSLTLISADPIPPRADQARKDQINRARNKRNANLRLQGLTPPFRHPRFVSRFDPVYAEDSNP